MFLPVRWKYSLHPRQSHLSSLCPCLACQLCQLPLQSHSQGSICPGRGEDPWALQQHQMQELQTWKGDQHPDREGAASRAFLEGTDGHHPIPKAGAVRVGRDLILVATWHSLFSISDLMIPPGWLRTASRPWQGSHGAGRRSGESRGGSTSARGCTGWLEGLGSVDAPGLEAQHQRPPMGSSPAPVLSVPPCGSHLPACPSSALLTRCHGINRQGSGHGTEMPGQRGAAACPWPLCCLPVE